MTENIKHGGFRAVYYRPPLFLIVTASTAEQLAAKVAELDAKMARAELKEGAAT